jgi:hypothetical protein
MSDEIKEVHDVAYHRNGVCGEGFYIVYFTNEQGLRMIGVCFPNDKGDFAVPEKFYNPRTAVFDVDLLADGNIKFGENSWRGDRYDDELRTAILKWEPDADLK